MLIRLREKDKNKNIFNTFLSNGSNPNAGAFYGSIKGVGRPTPSTDSEAGHRYGKLLT
jgi:hypothetical protein